MQWESQLRAPEFTERREVHASRTSQHVKVKILVFGTPTLKRLARPVPVTAAGGKGSFQSKI